MSTSSSGKSLKIDESVEMDTDQESINDNMDSNELEAAEARCTKSLSTGDTLLKDKNISTVAAKISTSEHKMTNIQAKESQDKVVKSLAEIKNKDPRFLSKKKHAGIDDQKVVKMQPNSSDQKEDPKVMSQMMSMDPWCFSSNDIDNEGQTKKEIENPDLKSQPQEDEQNINLFSKKENSPTKDNEPCKSLPNDNESCKPQSSSSSVKKPFKINMQNPFGKMKTLREVPSPASNVPIQIQTRKQSEQVIEKSELATSTSGFSRKNNYQVLEESASPECQQNDTPKMILDETVSQSKMSEATTQQVGEMLDQKPSVDNSPEIQNITRTVTNDLAGFQKPNPVIKPENFNRFGLMQRISGMYGTGSFESLKNVTNPQVLPGEFSSMPFGGNTPGALPYGGNTPGELPFAGNTLAALPFGGNTPGALPYGGNTSGSLPVSGNISGSLPFSRTNAGSFPMEQMSPGFQPFGMSTSDPYSTGASTNIDASTSVSRPMGASNSRMYPLGSRFAGTYPIDSNTNRPYFMGPSASGQFPAGADASGMYPMGASRLGSMPMDSGISGMSGLLNPRGFVEFPPIRARGSFEGLSPYENYNQNFLTQRGMMLGSLEGGLTGDFGSLEEIERKKQRNMMELKQLEEMRLRKLQEIQTFQKMEMKNRMEKEMEMYLTHQLQPAGFGHIEHKLANSNSQTENSQMPDVLAQIQFKENQIKLLQKQKQMDVENTDLDDRKNENKMSVKQRLGLGLKKQDNMSPRDPGLDDLQVKIETRKNRFGRNLSPFRDNEKSISETRRNRFGRNLSHFRDNEKSISNVGKKRKSGERSRYNFGGKIPDDLVLTEFGEHGPIKKIAKNTPSSKVRDDQEILADLDPKDPMGKCILDSFNDSFKPTIKTNVSEISGVMGPVTKKNLDPEVEEPDSNTPDADVCNEIKKDVLDFDESDLNFMKDGDVVNEDILDSEKSDEEDMEDLVFDEQEQFELEKLGKF